MAQNRGGLSSVDEIEEEIEEEQPTTEPGLGVVVGSGKSASVASPSTLEAMAELYNQRAAKQNSFMEALKDAAAWAGGGVGGPTETLRMRDEQRSKQAAELFSMQNQIAQHRQAMLDSNIFLGTPQPTAAAQGQVTPGGATATDAGAAPSLGRVGGLVDMIKDPNLKRQISHLYATDKKAAHQQLNKYLMESSPMTGELARRINMIRNDPNTSDDDKARYETLAIVGAEGFKPVDQVTKRGTIPAPLYKTVPVAQGTPAAAAIKNPAPPPLPQQAPQGAAPQQPPQAGMPPAAAPGAAPRAPAAAPATAPRAPAAAPATPPTAAAPSTPATMAPKASSAAPSYLGNLAPESKEGVALQQKAGEKELNVQEERQKLRAKEVELKESEIEKAGETAGDRIASIENIKNILDRHVNASGPLAKPGLIPAILGTLASGFSVGNFGSLSVPGIEQAVLKIGAMKGQDQATIDAAKELTREYAGLNLANAQSFLKGQGAVSDAERELIKQMSGSASDSPGAARRFMAFQQKKAEYNKQIFDEVYLPWRRQNMNADFREFIYNNPEFLKRREQYGKDLKALANSPIGSEKPPQAKKSLDSHPGRALLDKYPKR